ncbi:MAG: hypothetical protein ABIT70_11125, partial [Sulfuriferula sp.]
MSSNINITIITFQRDNFGFCSAEWAWFKFVAIVNQVIHVRSPYQAPGITRQSTRTPSEPVI